MIVELEFHVLSKYYLCMYILLYQCTKTLIPQKLTRCSYFSICKAILNEINPYGWEGGGTVLSFACSPAKNWGDLGPSETKSKSTFALKLKIF